MIKFTDEDIMKLDERFAREGVPFHARPLRAAQEILGGQFVMGVLDNPQVKEITQAYERLFPEVRYTWPGMGTGLAASLDRVRKVTVGVVFGAGAISVDKGLDFSSHGEWAQWCRNDERIAARSAFAFADMNDLVYGIDLYRSNHGPDSVTFWGLAAGQLKLVAESLSQSGAIGSAVLQPICLTAELAMKGTLLRLGVTEAELKSPKLYGHNLLKLAQKMSQECNHRDDSLILSAVSKFPDYVIDRYRETQLSRLDVIALALDAQFIAASSVRRLSGDDLAVQMELTGPGPRYHFFP